MAKYDYKKVVDYILSFANETGEVITNLKLQKLVYYAQAWYLANFKQPLFDNDFQAWIHGPVIPELYDEYKSLVSEPIVLTGKEIEETSKQFEVVDKEFLDELLGVYMPFGAYQLELMTHKEDPWIEARKGFAPDQKCINIIPKRSMEIYYAGKI